MIRRALGALAAATCAAGLAGCGDVAVTVRYGGSPTPAVPVASGAEGLPTPFSLPPVPASSEVADLRLARGGGGEVPLGDLRGARGTVVAFWRSDCIPCRDELPALQRLEPALTRQGVALVLADAGESEATAAAFLRDRGVTLQSWIDPGWTAHDRLGLAGVPATAVLGPDGSVRDRLEGAADLGPLQGALEAMGISAQ